MLGIIDPRVITGKILIPQDQLQISLGSFIVIILDVILVVITPRDIPLGDPQRTKKEDIHQANLVWRHVMNCWIDNDQINV